MNCEERHIARRLCNKYLRAVPYIKYAFSWPPNYQLAARPVDSPKMQRGMQIFFEICCLRNGAILATPFKVRHARTFNFVGLHNLCDQ